MPMRKLTVMRLVMTHQILEPIVPVPTKVPWLMPATPVFPFPIRLNQVPGHLLRLVAFHCQKVGQWLDLLGIFILAPLKEGTSREEVTQPNALGPDLPQWLWKHYDCYNLQKVQMRVIGMVQVALLGTRRHRDEKLRPIQLLPILLWFPRRWRSAWIRQSGGRSSHCWERQRRGKSNKKKFVLSYPTG
jgi:hypothetical protein